MWPTDPFRLLGVEPGVSPRDLKRAYHALIRIYKPEHSPAEFRTLHEAYEAVQRFTTFRFAVERSPEDDDRLPSEPEPEVALSDPRQRSDSDQAPALETNATRDLAPTQESENDQELDRSASDEYWTEDQGDERDASGPLPNGPRPRFVAADPWQLACDGNAQAAYRRLLGVVETHQARAEPFVQLYWLLLIAPELDQTRHSIDWLIRGIRACRAGSMRLRELLRREMTTDPVLAIGDRMEALFGTDIPADVVVEVAGCRWRAAQTLKSWDVISSDLSTLRPWLAEGDAEAWVSLLIAASARLNWAPERIRHLGLLLRQEAEELAAAHAIDLADDLTGLEYAELVAGSLQRFNHCGGNEDGLYELIASSWDEFGPREYRRMLAFLRSLVRDPAAGLARLDSLKAEASAALGVLLERTGQSETGRVDPDLADEIVAFASRNRWQPYSAFRFELLGFSLRHMVAPADFAGIVARKPNFGRWMGENLVDAIGSDFALHLLYRACELCWE
jgi:hypothetical protein